MNKLYYLGQPADGYGWGVANTNLVRELSKLCDCAVDTTSRVRFDAPVFTPIADNSLNPLRRIKKAPRILGYCFTEWPLKEGCRHIAKQYDVVFCGSEWNTQRLIDAGVKHARTLCQGVDFERFKPTPMPTSKGFVVFSGGKYEFRKSQDYVIAAMRAFMKFRTDAVLITAWHNPWPATINTMVKTWLMDPTKPMDGIDKDRVVMLPSIPNEKTPSIYAMAHVGVFPNRCEAGTNMVMTEFMACARPVIASYATGQKDVLGGPGPMLLENGSYDPAGWFNPSVSDILYYLEYAYNHRDDLKIRGEQCRKLVEPFTWESCAKKIYQAAFQDE